MSSEELRAAWGGELGCVRKLDATRRGRRYMRGGGAVSGVADTMYASDCLSIRRCPPLGKSKKSESAQPMGRNLACVARRSRPVPGVVELIDRRFNAEISSMGIETRVYISKIPVNGH